MEVIRKINYLSLLWILFLVVLFLFFRYSPFNGDSLLAWPISLKIQDDRLFGSHDLLINAAKSTPFLFYKLLGYFPLFQENYPLRDVVIYFPLIFLQALGWFMIFNHLTKNQSLSILTLAVFFFSDSKLGLHWSYAPFPGLVSYSAIHFLHIFSLYFFLKNNYKISSLFLGVASFIHPATSLCYFLVAIGSFSLKRRWSNLSWFTLFFLVFFIPNYFLFLKGINQSVDLNRFFEIYENFQYHAYIQDHLQEGYLYFLMSLLLVSMHSKIAENENKNLNSLLIISIIGCVVWLINLYWVKLLALVYFYFPMRIFYLIKPLIILQVIYMMFHKLIEVKDKPFKDVILYILLTTFVVKTFFNFSSMQGALMLLSYLFYLSKKIFPLYMSFGFFLLSLSLKTTFEIEVILFSVLALTTLTIYLKNKNELRDF